MSLLNETKEDLKDISEYIILKFSSNGQYYLNGLSSSYSFQYDIITEKKNLKDKKVSDELLQTVRGVISDKEMAQIISRLNEQLLSFWPCTTCFIIAYSCIPCTLGFSLLCPNYCISQAEDHAIRLLENIRFALSSLLIIILFIIIKV